MANYTMKDLRKDSVIVRNGMITVYPQFKREDRINFPNVATFNGAFSSNNGTLAFVFNSVLYVTPATRRAYEVLSDEGFIEKHFYVPFSNGDYPKEQELRWRELCDMQRKLRKEDFAQDCIEYCDKHYIGALDDETLARCFLMPIEGVEVEHIRYRTTYYPAITNTFFDCTVPDKLGKFCCNNGRVVFIYRDGTTRVVRGYWIVELLEAAGYKAGSLFVPFSNGEVIVNPVQRSDWEKISK